MYKLAWEMVKQSELYRYCNADPRWYSNTTQIVPNSEIPNEHWHKIDKVVPTRGEVEQQYVTLKRWSNSDKEFVRNVKLYKAPDPEVEWEEVD